MVYSMIIFIITTKSITLDDVRNGYATYYMESWYSLLLLHDSAHVNAVINYTYTLQFST